MKKRLVSIFIIILLLVSTVSNVFAATVTLDSIPDKKPGDSVVISGTTTLNETTIKVVAPNTTVLYVNVVKGTTFDDTFDLPSDAKEGTYTVIAGQDSVVAKTTFNVISEPTTVPVSGVSLDRTTATVKVGEEVQLTATVSPANATNKGVTWSSSNAAVATVDQTGKVKAVKAGSTTITVTTVDGNYNAKCEVTVEDTQSHSVMLDNILDKKPGDSVVISGTTTFDEITIKVIAPNTTVLYLDVVKGTPFTTTFNLPSDAKEGTYTVIAGRDLVVAKTTFNVISESTTVPVSGVSLDRTTATVKVGEEVQLTATVSPANATNKGVTWSSSNAAVATVDQTGKVKAVKAGSTTITVKTVDGNYTAKCEVTVEETAPGEVKVTGVTLDKATAAVKVGETVQLTATVTPANATNKGVTWSSSNEAVATVDQTGKVKAVKAGSAAITVTTKDGNFSASCDITVQNKPSDGGSSSGGGSSTPNTTPKNPTTSTAEIIIGGQSQQDAVTVTNREVDGKTVTTVKVNGAKVIEQIKKEQAKSTVTISVDTKSDVVVGSLSGDILAVMEQKDMVVEIKTKKATYLLPIAQINIGDISKELGLDVELKDINLEISIAEPNEEDKGMLDRVISTGGLGLIGEPVEFKVSCSYGDKSISISKFNQYIQREILIPDSVDTSKPLTAVVLNSDGTLSPVPTKIVIRDGKKYAVISSLTNSTYAVVSKEKSFVDVENHWAKEEINDMASRLIINGLDENTFAPSKDITRAEFATIVTKALGLRGKEATLTFTDIQKGVWYSDAVAAAYEYGIVGGYEDNTFRANQKITRQEAMVMLSRAMKIAGMEVELEVDAINAEINQFTDAEEIANWAKEGAAICIKNDIFGGSEGRITPKANITRGQTAVVVYRLLVNAGLI